MKALSFALALLTSTAAFAQTAGVTVNGPNYVVTINEEAMRKVCIATDQVSGRLIVATNGASACVGNQPSFCDGHVWRSQTDSSPCKLPQQR